MILLKTWLFASAPVAFLFAGSTGFTLTPKALVLGSRKRLLSYETSVATQTTSSLEMTSESEEQFPNLGPKAPPPGFLRRRFPTLPWHRLPNILTYLRCASIPALMVLFYQPGRHVETGVLFALTSFTDWLDGFLARRWDIATPFGAFLDPVADKLIVTTSLMVLSGRYGAVIALPASVILAREIAVSALREWMAQRGQRDVVKVGRQGKVKAAATMVALTLLLFVPEHKVAGSLLAKLFLPGLALLYLCAVITVTSGSVYFRAAVPLLLE